MLGRRWCFAAPFTSPTRHCQCWLGSRATRTWGSGPHRLGVCSPRLFPATRRPQRRKEASALHPSASSAIREEPNKIGRVKIVRGHGPLLCDQLPPKGGGGGLLNPPSLWGRGSCPNRRGLGAQSATASLSRREALGATLLPRPPQTSPDLPASEDPDGAGEGAPSICSLEWGRGQDSLPHTWTRFHLSTPEPRADCG